jgi:hypothetical protein
MGLTTAVTVPAQCRAIRWGAFRINEFGKSLDHPRSCDVIVGSGNHVRIQLTLVHTIPFSKVTAAIEPPACSIRAMTKVWGDDLQRNEVEMTQKWRKRICRLNLWHSSPSGHDALHGYLINTVAHFLYHLSPLLSSSQILPLPREAKIKLKKKLAGLDYLKIN